MSAYALSVAGSDLHYLPLAQRVRARYVSGDKQVAAIVLAVEQEGGSARPSRYLILDDDGKSSPKWLDSTEIETAEAL